MKIDFDMTYKDEATLLRHTMQFLESHKRTGLMPIRINDRYVKGYSDIFVVVRGIFVAIELKDETGVASVHQKLFIKDVIAAGGVAGICRTLGDVSRLIGQAVIKSGECYKE